MVDVVGVAGENSEVEAVGRGTWSLLPDSFTPSHPERSVFLQNVPATLDARVTDNSQDDLVNRLKQLTVKPTDIPPRPDFGTVGPSFKLRTNFFPIKLPKRTIYEYNIEITPGATIKRIKRRIFELAEATNDWTQHGLKGKVAHDFSSKLFFFFFLSSNFYPGGHPFGQAGWLSTTQVLKGSLLPESGKDEKEKQRESFIATSRGRTS